MRGRGNFPENLCRHTVECPQIHVIFCNMNLRTNFPNKCASRLEDFLRILGHTPGSTSGTPTAERDRLLVVSLSDQAVNT